MNLRRGQRDLTISDVRNVLLRGWVDPAGHAFERGTHRYQVHTNKMVVVVLFRSSRSLKVVTAWRKDK